MAAFATIATTPGRDANTPFPLLRTVGENLTIDQLMPPCLLRWSRRMGRPVMGDLWRHDTVGYCFIEELRDYEATIDGVMLVGEYPRNVRESSTLHRGHRRDQIWFLAIIGDEFEDAPYKQAWRLRYGSPWPLVGLYEVHPVLRRLYESNGRFLEDVYNHGRERERELRWARLPPRGPDGD